MAGRLPEGRVVLFDDDHYYMAAVIAERIHETAASFALVTSENSVAAWGSYTAEQARSQRRLMELGVEIVTAHALAAFDDREARLTCGYTGRSRSLPADSLVLVTARRPNDELFHALQERLDAGAEPTPQSLRRIGDCEAPAIIAAAVYAGHRYARELDAPSRDPAEVSRDRTFDAVS